MNRSALDSKEAPTLLNCGIDEPGSLIGPQSWLFHDLVEHDFGEDQPMAVPAQLLRVDDIQVEIVVRYGLRVNLMGNEPMSATFSRGKTGILP